MMKMMPLRSCSGLFVKNLHMWYSAYNDDKCGSVYLQSKWRLECINTVRCALADGFSNFCLLINCLVPVEVYLHGTSSPLPNLLCPVTTHCRVNNSRTAECCEAILELQYRHVEKKCNEKNTQNICLILIQKSIGVLI